MKEQTRKNLSKSGLRYLILLLTVVSIVFQCNRSSGYSERPPRYLIILLNGLGRDGSGLREYLLPVLLQRLENPSLGAIKVILAPTTKDETKDLGIEEQAKATYTWLTKHYGSVIRKAKYIEVIGHSQGAPRGVLLGKYMKIDHLISLCGAFGSKAAELALDDQKLKDMTKGIAQSLLSAPGAAAILGTEAKLIDDLYPSLKSFAPPKRGVQDLEHNSQVMKDVSENWDKPFGDNSYKLPDITAITGGGDKGKQYLLTLMEGIIRRKMPDKVKLLEASMSSPDPSVKPLTLMLKQFVLPRLERDLLGIDPTSDEEHDGILKVKNQIPQGIVEEENVYHFNVSHDYDPLPALASTSVLGHKGVHDRIIKECKTTFDGARTVREDKIERMNQTPVN